jgi:CubicO group peptidase (beta-lactamase class C family)
LIPRFAALLGLLASLIGTSQAADGPTTDRPARTEDFEREIEGLRRLLGLPGLQVAVVQDDRIALERAYGHANLETKIPMTTDHLIEIASVTKTMTAVVMMQLVEEGKVSLDDRVVKYPFHRWFNSTRITPEVRLRHVLSHTSQGPLGEVYCYQGNRFGFVLGVFGTTPESYGEAVARRLFRPLHMDHTLPQPGVALTDERRSSLATPYGGFDPATGKPTPLRDPPIPKDYYPSACFFSNVKDLARYAIALQHHSLISDKSHDLIESPTMTRDGRALPYGIGWFAQDFADTRLVWHYGYGNGSSALLLRVPAKRITLIALANSENMSESTRLGYGDVLDSPFAITFLKHFVFVKETPHESPTYEGRLDQIRASMTALGVKQVHPLYFEELFTQAVVRELMSGPNRDSSKAQELMRIIQELSPKLLLDSGLTGLEVLSRYDDPGLNSATEALGRTLTRSQSAHPAALFFASRFFEKTGRRSEAIRLLERLADSGFGEEPLTLDACILMGDYLKVTDPERARAYYWRAVRIGGQSPKANQAIESLNAIGR